jgi:hypothetical protein
MNRMTVLYEEISHKRNKDKYHNSNKGAIYYAIKAVVRKSILIRTPRAKAANTFH